MDGKGARSAIVMTVGEIYFNARARSCAPIYGIPTSGLIQTLPDTRTDPGAMSDKVSAARTMTGSGPSAARQTMWSCATCIEIRHEANSRGERVQHAAAFPRNARAAVAECRQSQRCEMIDNRHIQAAAFGRGNAKRFQSFPCPA